MLAQTINYIAKNWTVLCELTWQHLQVTGVAMFFAILIAVPLGILLTRCKRISSVVLGLVGVLQTIPSLALLVLMIPFFGIGFRPAVLALILYALLPIVRDTYIGVKEVTPALVEAAWGMGMTRWQILTRVQIPIALPIIFSGIRTATVICVGTATIAALIGSGGLGSLIYRGLQQLRDVYVITGALLSAILALALDYGLGLVELHFTPKGLRTRRQQT